MLNVVDVSPVPTMQLTHGMIIFAEWYELVCTRQTYDREHDDTLNGNLGVETKMGDCAGAIAYYFCKDDFSFLGELNLGGSSTHSLVVNRASSLSYEYAFTFSTEIATSTDPLIAGHPSDVIIGGGVDLYVKEGVEGENLF